MKCFIKFLVLFLSLPVFVFSSNDIGQIPIVNFHHSQYNGHSQSWAIAQDKRGMVYIANNVGVIEYDGTEWRHISINNALARCLGLDSSGTVWVGGQDEFGYLAADSCGLLRYVSLTSYLPEEHSKPGLIRQIYPTKNSIYFSTFDALYRLNKDNSISFWEPKTKFHRSYFIDNILFINQRDYGLTYLKNDSLVKVQGTEILGTQLVYTILPFNTEYFLVGTQRNGFYLLKKQALYLKNVPNDFQSLIPFKTSNDDFFRHNRVYNGVALDKNHWAIGTYSGGVAIINNLGKIVRKISKQNGLQDNTVWFLYKDNVGNIWMALNNGISFSPYISQLTSWTHNEGISGVVQSVVKFRNKVYYTSNTGVYVRKDSGFIPIKGINDLSWGLFIYQGNDRKEYLIVGTSSGIYQINDSTANLIAKSNVAAYSFEASHFFPNIIYVSMYDGIGVIKEDNGEFNFLGYLLKTDYEVYKLTEDLNGDIWFTLRYQGMGFLDVVNPYQLVAEGYRQYKLPYNPKCDDISVNFISEKILVSSEKGLSSYNKETDSFEPDSLLGTQFTNGTTGLRIFNQDRRGDIWFESYVFSANRKLERATLVAKNKHRRTPAQFSLIPETIFFDVYTDSIGVTWIASTEGVFRFDPNSEFKSIFPRVFIRKVTIKNRKLIYGGCNPAKGDSLEFQRDVASLQTTFSIPYTSNDLTFTYTSPYFLPNHKMLYSYKLEGYDDDWSEWSYSQVKEYTNLSPGEYRFMVKSRTMNDIESPIEFFDFQIESPFYLKWYAFIFYIVLLGVLVLIIVRVNTRILRVSNVKLQRLVDERTKELKESERALTEKTILLQQQKEEILSQRDELEARNHHINDSIQYAKTIQQAILPDLNNVFANEFDHFLIYLPKEVVSGDFYWTVPVGPKSRPNDKLFIAVVDCTGHGVPGAFMSLIGSRLLSEIVLERKNHNPAAVLTELNTEINRALRQDVSESFDGMDVALCLIERKTDNAFVITFSGANRPLYYFTSGDNMIQTIKGNRKSIGSMLPDVEQEFTNWRITLHPGDMLFMATDGIVDQNNQFRKKFTSCRLHTVLLSASNLPMSEMARILLSEFNNFKGDEPQRDDITVLGLKLK